MQTNATRRANQARWAVAIAYIACWVVGLSIGGPALEPNATAERILDVFAGSWSMLAFAVLVHAVAAGLLVALGWSLASHASGRVLKVLAVTAGALSLLQFVGEAALVAMPNVADPVAVWQTLARIDAIKMLVLAALIVAFHGGPVRGRIVLFIVSVTAALALLVSGVGYLLLEPALMDAAIASLPLLLLWVIAATASRTTEARRAQAQRTARTGSETRPSAPATDVAGSEE